MTGLEAARRRSTLFRLANEAAKPAGFGVIVRPADFSDSDEVILTNKKPQYFGAIIVSRAREESSVKAELVSLVEQMRDGISRMLELN